MIPVFYKREPEISFPASPNAVLIGPGKDGHLVIALPSGEFLQAPFNSVRLPGFRFDGLIKPVGSILGGGR